MIKISSKMTAEEFLHYLNQLNIKLYVHEGKLRCNAPKGALTAELQQELKKQKEAILALLEDANKSSQTVESRAIPKRNGLQPAQLSFAQQRLWFLQQLEPESHAYHMNLALRFQGSLNLEALQQALNAIVTRHEILRTRFVADNGVPMQVIEACAEISLPLVDLSSCRTELQEEALQSALQKVFTQTFDLSADLMLRTSLVRLNQDEHVLQIVLHHIAADGWSINVLTRELSHFYHAFSSKQRSLLSTLPVQYVDFAEWQRQWLQGENLERHLAYWRETLKNITPLELPTDYQRPAIQTHRGQRHNLVLDSQLTRRLKTLSQGEGATLFMSLLAAFKLLLARLSGQEDIVVGSPIAGRNQVETESLVGLFIDTVVLRTNLGGEPSFRDLLGRVRQIALGAYTHQEVPFEKLVQELQPERDLSRTPFFQVWFNMFSLNQDRVDFAGLKTETLVTQTEPSSKFDLTLYIEEKTDELRLNLVSNADLFSPERMENLLQQYEYLLQQIVSTPDRSISQYSLINPAKALNLPNPKEFLRFEPGQVIYHQFVQNSQRHPQCPAIVDAQGVWSYECLNHRSNQLTHYLYQQGVQPEDIVAIYGSRSASLVLAILGVLKAGATFTILDPAYPEARLIQYLQIAQPKAWISLESSETIPDQLFQYTKARTWQCQLQLPLSWQNLPDSLSQLANHELTAVVPNPERGAYITFTSGSTGQPKAIKGTHSPVYHFLDWYGRTFSFTSSDRFSLLSGLSHDPLLRDIFTPLTVGATLYIPSRGVFENPEQLIQWLQDNRITVMHLTPALGSMIKERAVASLPPFGCDLPALKYACFGGDMLARSAIIELEQLAPQATYVNFYGSTETPQVASYFVIPKATEIREGVSNPSSQKIPIGKGIDDVQLLILNPSKKLAGIGELGEICVRTPYLSKGYINNDQLNRERFLLNPFTDADDDYYYRTGDLARYLPDGNIEFLGRNDHQVKIRGFRIELGEIEIVLSQHPAVQQCVVMAREDEPGDKRLVAYFVAPAPEGPSNSELRQFLRQSLPDYMVPATFIHLESLPLTPNGKIDRRALPKPSAVNMQTSDSYVAPRTPQEQKIADILARALKLERVSIYDNFFELGGHSLLAVQVFSEIERAWEKKLPLSLLFKNPSVDELAKALQSQEKTPTSSSLVALQPNGSKTPIFGLHAIGTSVQFYRSLAKYLDPDQPFYGLQSRFLDQASPDLKLEDMAAFYIKEIKTIQPKGPYLLVGYSFGGRVVYEMAQQLQQSGQTVSLLAIIDAPAPGGYKRLTLQQQILRHGKNFATRGATYAVEKVSRQVNFRIFQLKKSLKRSLTPKNPELNSSIYFKSRLRQIEALHKQTLKKYQFRDYSGKITLFKSDTRPDNVSDVWEPTLGWSRFAKGELEIYDIPGEHYSIFKEPNVQILAEKLNHCIHASLTTSDTL